MQQCSFLKTFMQRSRNISISSIKRLSTSQVCFNDQEAALVNQNEVDGEALKYLNRLSDFLFTLARYAAKHDGVEETIYIRPDPRFKIYKPVKDTNAWKKSKD